MKNLLKKLKSWGVSRRPVADLSRRQSSLVSCGELTPDAVQLWLGLPDEVKFDPALEDFRKLYEKEHGGVLGVSSQGSKSNRLLLVSSAPHLNGNLQIASNIILKDGERQNCDFKADKEQTEEKVDETSTPRRISKLAKMGHYTKMTLLVASWVFFTVIFLMFNERELIVMNSAVSPGEVKKFFINSSSVRNSLLITLSGPFLSEQTEQKMNKTEFQKMSKFEVWLENNDQSINEVSKLWQILLQDITSLDFNTGETRSSVLKLKSSNLNQTSYAVKLRSTVDAVTPFRMTVLENPLDIKTGVLYASFLLVALYTLIIFEIVNRTMAAVIVSISSLAVLAMVGQRPTIPEVISWLDVETLILLFSMMLLVAIMAETGIFDFFAVFTFEVTKGRLWPLVTVLCIITAVVSTFLDNVTTILLMIPVTIRLCEVMDLNPVPILMSMVLYSNIGGTATPVGDPPNVIIASNKAVIQAGINFANFTLHMTLGIILVCIQTYFQLRFIYRDSNKLRLNVPREIQDLRNTISIWRRAIDSLPHLSKDELIVRERLEKKVRKLSSQLHVLVRESSKRACPKDTFQSTLNELKNKHKIRDKVLLLKASVAILFVVTVFFLHSLPELNRVSLGWTALLGAILLLILADRENLEPILHRVEWSTLLFFAALFVLMEALSKLGLIEFIGGLTESLILMVDEKARLAVALLLMIWVSGITSAFIDNIPLTTMMIRIVTSLGSNPNLGLPMAPLIWALSFAVCLGGNGTLIGASANVVCAGVAEQHGYKFTFLEFFKVGFPVMIGHLIVASGYLLLCHCVFTWH